MQVEKGREMIKNQQQTQKAKEDQGSHFTSSASALPTTTPNTKREPFLGCVADLLLNIHGIKSIVAKNLGAQDLRVCDRPSSLETHMVFIRKFRGAYSIT